ncbi:MULTISPECIES: SusC/RagA family TonB-linked outer membrane protein [Alistipes]|jgi:TonB-linked SusC/RagA family outer membrane protein|uniref:Outer membrane receptor proteins, mostly Fe transport n=2 Tax=Alistipes shahii TaxID=328814 RepID=D4INV4_9BACT|nr:MULTISPECIES: SusC/RagA family TonB-linked outer membrane protein [Alistipes]KAA2367011.1 SusC/RagA family TonB-linked outer membrane protein [Alistipes shahii]MCO7107598.1 SusC/RagA family TonB-linked outer membrane protein [Alistipes shahii]MDR3834381.1 SusC/RagA family TonB-linked outer membrane protein [Alistipes sp.]UWN67152.1 SusC/RagA family TonB-linked outer membrane protein [Alistipes shahii WAL 8301]CBK64616.1 Outer membrane receptor proteins, mostly Fe transport [Alistipes shahii
MTSFCLIAPATALRSYAQEGGGSTLEGLIKDDSGPLLGATVIVKNTTRGTTTDMDGKFRLEGLQPGDVLQVTYVGYDPYEVTYTGQTTLDILMTTTANQLNAVVVTAMGIERQSKTLSYAAETVGGDDVADIKSVNMINALQGKAAGLQITPNSTGAGGSSKILFRGNKSINGSNQPLVVVDGVPLMMNITSEQVNSNWGAQRDGGDAMSTINPDDIASISLLKGASAAALYGAVAANGAIMITTKSAMAGRLAVNVSSNTTIDTPLSLPEFQNTYGANGQYSWGDKLASKAPDYAEKFFRTGWTTNNSISINGGAEDLRAYFSYGNVTSGGITPENDYSQHTLNAKVGFDLFNDHIKVDFNAKYVNQHISNQPAGGFVFNPLVGTYTFPRGGDWNGYKSNFETYNGELNANVQNWVTTTDETNSNPYWLLNRERPVVERNRYEFGGSIKYQIIDGLSLTGRMRYERADEHYVRNHYASSYGNKYTYGKMDDNRYFSEQLYADLLAQYNHTWDDFSLNATLGTSMMQTRSNNVSLLYEQSKFVAPGNGGAYYPNIFNPSNFYMNGTTMGLERKRLNSVFGAVTFGFKEALFLDVTARNDWSSALAYTDGYSFFYPSVGASLLLNRFVDMGRNIDLFKFRGSYSIVGNDVPVYKTNPRYTYGDQGAINPPESVPFRTLKPEKTHSFEVGFDGEFFQHRLHVNATYYKTNTKNQYFEVTLPWESGYKSQFVNAGNVQNQGFELTAGWFQDFGNEFTWSTDLNLSYNDNKIIELFDGIQDGVTVSNLGGAKVILYEGGQYGDLYVRTLKRDESGKLVTETPEGADYQIPVNGGEQNSDLKYMGNMNSKWNMGWNNTFRYKDLTLSMLIDFRIGGKVVSMTEATLDGYGVSERTGRARDRGYVMREGIKFSNVKAYYDVVGATSFNSVYNVEDYVYDATNVRMREISLGYTFRNLFGQSKNLTLAFIARNLFFFYKDAPMDPDVSMGTGNGLQGFDVFNLPTTRSFGLNVKLNF